ncbi:helix-turn-helix transcriptional regulator [Streptomyces sp. SCSIO 30461]|uniref:helix-turn-helix domain-containing protein n=1 Tax=Streptomyces sp. SCSIO 30461 TaxID=3118085 RepID=UPI0030CF73CD
MDAAPDAAQADDLAQVIASIDELLAVLGLDGDVIELDDISHRTGIPVDRVRTMLRGGQVEPRSLPEIFQQRLVFLRETRLKPGGKQYSHDEIAAGAGISHGQVGYMLRGERMPGLKVLGGLERFFEVPPGFFTAGDRDALCRALQPVHDSLTHTALLKGKGITQLAMRSSASNATPGRLGDELRAALTFALNQPDPGRDDPEVRELTDTMLALTPKSRRRILPLIQGVLGLVRPDPEHPGDDTGPRAR